MTPWRARANLLGVRIFVSYARARFSLAHELAVALRQEGFEVFFDDGSMDKGSAVHAAVRAAIRRAHLLVFLVSPESIAPGSYALTELAIAEEQWPDPSNRVLPVIVEWPPGQALPAYIRGLARLTPEGNSVATILAAIARLRRGRRLRAVAAAAMVAAVASTAALVGAGRKSPPGPPPADTCHAELQLAPPPSGTVDGLYWELVHDGTSQVFLIASDSRAPVSVSLSPNDEVWRAVLHARDGSALGELERRGCPKQESTESIPGGMHVTFRPR